MIGNKKNYEDITINGMKQVEQKKKKIEYLKLENGKSPIVNWLNSLDKSIYLRIIKRLIRIEEGNYGDCKKLVDNELFEIRFDFGKGYRIYYVELDEIILLLVNGGDKSTQTRDIQNAQNLLNKWRLENEKKI